MGSEQLNPNLLEGIKTPQVSVVIPAYNQAQFLFEALHSVFAQTLRGFEIIVVDDGSTDDTPQVVRSLANSLAEDIPLYYVRQTNQGLAGARNTGILQAQAELVALLDSDDQWLPTYLEKMVELAALHPQAIVFYCEIYYMDAESHALPQLHVVNQIPSEKLYSALLRENFLVPSTILIRRSAVLEAGLFDPAFRRLQDWELWLRLLKNRQVFVGSTERLVRYRLHGNSLSTDPEGGQRAAQAMVEKLFGPDDGQYSTWPYEKRRAYGGVYRYHALSSMLHKNDWRACAQYLRKALQADPSIAEDESLFYELALGSQPIGYRDTTSQIDWEASTEQLKQVLDVAFTSPLSTELFAASRQAFGTAYLALGLLAYNHGQTSKSKHYLRLACRYRPDLLRNRRVAGIWIRSLIGRSNINRLRHWKNMFRQSGGANKQTEKTYSNPIIPIHPGKE